MTSSTVTVELDDNGNVVRISPTVAFMAAQDDQVTYNLVAKDGTPWMFEGYVDPSGILAPPANTPDNPATSITLIRGDGSPPDSNQSEGLTLLYRLDLTNAMSMTG